jgi:ribonuclease P protein component
MQTIFLMVEFPRDHRLAKKHDFQFVFAKPHKATHKYLLALYRSNQKSHARLGIIIAKRYIKLAVQRNRLRRLVRESFRQHQNTLKGLDIVVQIRSECSPLDNKVLRNDIDRLWQMLIRS